MAGLGAVVAATDPLGLLRGGGTAASASAPVLTTLDQTLTRQEVGGYATITTGPGEPWVVRRDFTNVSSPTVRQPLLAFAQVSDMHITDHQSPLRVEFLDEFYQGLGTDSAYRPHEMLSTQLSDAMCRAIKRLGFGPRTGLPLALTLMTGDGVDNCQYNETRWYIGLLDGAMITPNSGDPNRDESHSSLALITAGDRGNRGRYWRPEEEPWVGSSTSKFPRIPGLLAAAHRSFQATGLGMPWYAAFGNHDGLVQGNLNVTAGDWVDDRNLLSNIATGSGKPVNLRIDLNSSLFSVIKDWVTDGPLQAVTVTADANRRLLQRNQFIAEHFNTTGLPHGHGFIPGGGDKAYYAIPAAPEDLFQFICLDTVNTAFSFGAGGSIDEAQWNWLEAQLKASSSLYELDDSDGTRPNTVINQPGVQDKLIIVFCHHTLDTMDHTDNGWDDTSPRFNGNQVRRMLHRFPNVIMMVNGHTHANNIWARASSWPYVLGGRFWEINTASHIDWPIQSRIIEVAEGDGILSIFTTMVDADAPLSHGNDLSTPARLAALGRELSANDPQEVAQGIDRRRGKSADGTPYNGRNAQLLMPSPFPIRPAANRLSSLFYRAGDGLAATGCVETSGAFTNLQNVGGFLTGWTHIVSAGGGGRALFYRAGDGVAATGFINSSGGFVNLKNVGPFGTNWTHVTPAGGGRALFYRAGDGVAVTGSVDSSGGFTSLQNVGGFLTGWTHIVSTGGGRLLFYRAADGVAATGMVDGLGGFSNLLNVGGFTTGWTHVVSAGGGRLLFYRAGDGLAVTGSVNGNGGFTSLQNVGGFLTGWTHIVSAGGGRLLFYRAGDGLAVTGSVDSNGGFTNLQNVGGFVAGWTHLADVQQVPTLTTVPDLFEKTPEQARTALTAAELQLGTTGKETVHDSILSGKVVSQSRNAGQQVTRGTIVNITIGEFKGGNQ
jgi:metallophosphoesterase (TIGR03767 family)